MIELSEKRFWETVMLIFVLCLVIIVGYSIANKEPKQNKCIDGTLYWLTNQGYWQAYNIKCKVLTQKGEK